MGAGESWSGWAVTIIGAAPGAAGLATESPPESSTVCGTTPTMTGLSASATGGGPAASISTLAILAGVMQPLKPTADSDSARQSRETPTRSGIVRNIPGIPQCRAGAVQRRVVMLSAP